MKEIKLGGKHCNGAVVMVDDEDFEYLNQFSWHGHKHHAGKLYVKRKLKNGKHGIMHREIMKAEKGQIVDHIDRNPLNNQKSNLRFCDYSQNCKNRSPWKNGTSKYMGVYKSVHVEKRPRLDGTIPNIEYKRWKMEIKTKEGKKLSKSFPYTHEGEIQAAKYYDKLAKINHGEFAALNFPE